MKTVNVRDHETVRGIQAKHGEYYVMHLKFCTDVIVMCICPKHNLQFINLATGEIYQGYFFEETTFTLIKNQITIDPS